MYVLGVGHKIRPLHHDIQCSVEIVYIFIYLFSGCVRNPDSMMSNSTVINEM